jgi:cell division protein FtsW (lipid II flippase)
MSRIQTAARTLLLIAAILALAASVFIFFFAGGTQVTETTGGEVTEQQLSWLGSQGWWGIAILFIFSALYYGPLHFYRRGKNGMAVLFGAVAIGLTMLAGFSIGLFFMPAALCASLGFVFWVVAKISKPKTERLS